ncbi:exopolysaccharide biosynthesis protein exod [Pseudoroseomonas rhizosphaerae]|uniref:Exopolysaccharide biosynthesis protein exod n=1 Tax=Teichococcus rhizosphaerae TaxID=1335062 RepID=A0A2C6XX08_9PROT|nr:exopolysaccharide biosynthesis protein [Pseudoroseomonas rhizosphaerae]PHK93072.1 exopolysaccharide biosynthesis protein exod [Pseudoroseomonas rhizosphaerae]
MPDTLPPAMASLQAKAAHDESAPISRIVAEVAATFPGERISLGEMAEAFGERAFGLLILLLCLPSLLPGMASVFGLPMLILGVQMGLGWRVPKLPRFLAARTVKRTDLLRLASASSGALRRVERFVRPRPGWFTTAPAERLVGWMTVFSAAMLILPGPGTNGPPAFGTIITALGVVEQDSRVVGVGLGITLAGCLFAAAVLVALCWFGVQALGWIF